MKKDTTPKKVWQKPEVSDLDVDRTSSSPSSANSETISGSGAPVAS